ncbi:hypothetical protein Bca4012_103231 [Brassica carinata]
MVRLVFRPIPKSDERFARQYRCGPPPEFLWLRPPGIVHHLSVPTGMLTLEPFSEDQGRSVVHPLLGPCFKTGRMGSPQADALSTQMPRHAVRRVLQTTIKAATPPLA